MEAFVLSAKATVCALLEMSGMRRLAGKAAISQLISDVSMIQAVPGPLERCELPDQSLDGADP